MNAADRPAASDIVTSKPDRRLFNYIWPSNTTCPLSFPPLHDLTG
jgi:hypothetical protein